MLDKKTLQVGDKVDIFLGHGPTYRTILEDISEDGDLVISPPLRRGIPVILRRDQYIELYFYRTNGRYCIDCKVIDITVSNNLRLVLLRVMSEPRKQQRRESYRLSLEREGFIREYASGPWPLHDDEPTDKVITENISETGAAFRTKRQYERDERVYVRIFLRWPTEKSPPIEQICKVVQSEYDPEKKFHRIGVRFIDLSDDERSNIAKFVLVEQQRKIKQQRWLLEDDEEEQS